MRTWRFVHVPLKVSVLRIDSVSTHPGLTSGWATPSRRLLLAWLTCIMIDSQDDALSLALDLMRRLPPRQVTSHLGAVEKALPNEADDLASSVDQPLTLQIDDSKQGAGREFVCCEYNRDGSSWRSWYSNSFHPPLGPGSDGAESEPIVPRVALRELELQANDSFETYRKLYVDACVSLARRLL